MTLAQSLLVLCLIPSLGDDRFAARQHASALIAAMLPAGMEFIADAAAHDPDCEISRRAERIIQGYIESVRPGAAWPWIDCLSPTFPHRDDAVRDYLRRVRGPKDAIHWRGLDYPDYRDATRLFAQEQLLVQGQSAGVVKALLVEMAAREKKTHAQPAAAAGAP